MRNPVAAKRIEHCSPKVKLSEGFVHAILPGFHNATSLDQRSNLVWTGDEIRTMTSNGRGGDRGKK